MTKKRIKLRHMKLDTTIRKVLLILCVIMFAFGTAGIFKSFKTVEFEKKNQNLYQYTNDFSQNYTVNLKQNQYISEQSMPAGKQYVSDLISDLNMKLSYEYVGNQKVPITYSYKIDLVEKGNYTQDKEDYEIINEIINLKKSETLQETAEKIKINENFKVDFEKYHNTIKSFKQELGMNINSSLYVVLTVNTVATVDGKEVRNEYISDFAISLGNKVAIARGKTNDSVSGSIEFPIQKITQKSINVPTLIASVTVLLLALLLGYWVLFKTQKLYVLRNEFKEDVSKVLRLCMDRIVEVEDKVENGGDNIVRVSSIEELIKLSDELFHPILYHISEDDEIATFSLLNDRILYEYVIENNKKNEEIN